MKAAVGRISTGNVSKIATDRPHFKTGTVRYRPRVCENAKVAYIEESGFFGAAT